MAESAASEKLKVFVSYSRRDSGDFAEELVGGLELAGFAPFLDRHDIAAGEDWEARLGGLIQGADTLVFVVSPEAVKSERCAWEVDRALAQTKRLLPVIFKPVPDSDIPEPLRRLQFVRFDTRPGITRPLGQLAEALRQDIDWIREHTRFGELAGRWEARSRPDSLLLRGDDLAAAQLWAEKWTPTAPAITDLMRAFIAASKQAEVSSLAKANAAQRRMLRMQALVSSLLVVVIIGLIGLINQSFLKEQWRWYTITVGFKRAKVQPYVLPAAAEQGLKPKDTFRECAAEQGKDYCPKMVVVPAGSFVMGSPAKENGRYPDEGPQHPVTIVNPLAVSASEITFDEWDTCVAYGDCAADITDARWGRGQLPVINVTWDHAQQYLAWLSKITGKPYRLLTEAEYEYAARGGTQTAYPWGEEIGKNNANCNGCGSRWDDNQTAPVGSFSANAFALYDMVGNVFEWVEDCYHKSYDDAPTDGSAWIAADCNSRVVRGGSWSTEPRTVRSANRDEAAPDDRNHSLGFRVGRTLTH
jgi:formylglycine-generating enzyme required for sulfatase activity